MTGRIMLALALLLIIWASFAYTVTAWLRSEQSRCSKLGDLAAECFAPQGLIAMLVSTVFLIASGALVWLALRK